jgi:exopolysaccharide biosynthesis protein
LGTPNTVLSGGPLLVRDGKRLDLPRPTADSYEFNSMHERHPRSAIGWNAHHFFLVEVDGRQPGLSVGMTLKELASHLIDLGCESAMNLDGGGSATLWLDGQVRNRPCDGHERPIANALVVVRTADAGPHPAR